MAERRVKVHGIDIWTESFGDRGHPALLLIMGASAQGQYEVSDTFAGPGLPVPERDRPRPGHPILVSKR